MTFRQLIMIRGNMVKSNIIFKCLIMRKYCVFVFISVMILHLLMYKCMYICMTISVYCLYVGFDDTDKGINSRALNTFYLRLYGIGHMIKNHSDCKRGNQLQPHRLLFLISSKGSFISIIP